MAKAQNAKAKKKGGNVNRRNVWLLVLTTVLVLGSIFMFTPPQDKINQGLDIQGGLSVVLSAKIIWTLPEASVRRLSPDSMALLTVRGTSCPPLTA